MTQYLIMSLKKNPKIILQTLENPSKSPREIQYFENYVLVSVCVGGWWGVVRSLQNPELEVLIKGDKCLLVPTAALAVLWAHTSCFLLGRCHMCSKTFESLCLEIPTGFFTSLSLILSKIKISAQYPIKPAKRVGSFQPQCLDEVQQLSTAKHMLADDVNQGGST